MYNQRLNNIKKPKYFMFYPTVKLQKFPPAALPLFPNFIILFSPQ